MCGGGGAKPDYPEIEFGVHPFGAGNVLETTPPFSSTTLLPLQIKDIMSAGAQIDNFNLQLQSAVSWNISFEFWLSERNPLTDPNPGVHAELIVFWGWQNGRWPCDKTGDVSSAGKTYHLCHQDDQWADGKWATPVLGPRRSEHELQRNVRREAVPRVAGEQLRLLA